MSASRVSGILDQDVFQPSESMVSVEDQVFHFVYWELCSQKKHVDNRLFYCIDSHELIWLGYFLRN